MAKQKARDKLAKPTLEALLDIIEKKWGDAKVIRLGDAFNHPIDGISTGSLELDWILRAGCIPYGYYIELCGRQGIGKTTVATGIVIEASKSGLNVLYMEPEHKLAPTYFLECVAASGGDWDKIIHIKPPSGKAALEIILAAIGVVSLIIIDSMPALVTTKELDGETEDTFWAANAKLVAQFVKQATAKLGLSGYAQDTPVKTVIVGINQLRANMDAQFGPRTKPAGGWSWKHAQGVKIDFTGGTLRLNPEKESIGIDITASLGKSVIGKPRESTELTLEFGRGIHQSRDTLTMGLKMDLIEKRGAYYYFAGDNTHFAQGEPRAMRYLEQRSQLRVELRAVMRERVMERAKSESPFKSLARTLPILARCGRLEALAKFMRWNARLYWDGLVNQRGA